MCAEAEILMVLLTCVVNIFSSCIATATFSTDTKCNMAQTGTDTNSDQYFW